jgi:hypothetical protein
MIALAAMSYGEAVTHRCRQAVGADASFSWWVYLVVGLFIAGGVFDYWLVRTKRGSISVRAWIATSQHPTLIAAGVFLTLGTAYLVREAWGLVAFVCYVGGHVFSHDAPVEPDPPAEPPHAT